jgi:cytochrome P450
MQHAITSVIASAGRTLPSLPDWLSLDPLTKRVKLSANEPAFVQDPYRAYHHFHAAGGRVFWEEYDFWCFANFDEVNALLRDKRFGREVPPGARGGSREHLANFDRIERHSLLEMEPPEHTRLRRLVNRAFVSSQIERLRPQIETLCHRLIDGFMDAGEVDLLSAYATPIPLRVIAALMGVPEELEPAMLDWSHSMVKLYTLKATRGEELAADAACREFHACLSDLVAHKRRHAPQDLLGELAHGDLTVDETISTAVLLMNAGHEATVHQTGNAISLLLDPAHPGRRKAISNHGAAAVVEEALRFEAPLHLFTRYAAEDMDFGGGVTVSKGRQIGLLLGAANRDPSAIAESGQFMPGRADQKNVSFGAGIHFCIGAPLARMEMAISLTALFERLPGIALAGPARFADSYHFHGLETLRAVPRP